MDIEYLPHTSQYAISVTAREAQLIADGLDIINPDNPGLAQHARDLSFTIASYVARIQEMRSA